MSLRTAFHTTESLLVERKQLHYLIDFFWQKLPNTRDAVYARVSKILGMHDAHVSDLTSDQIKCVAVSFQKSLSEIAPCSECQYGRKTSYDIWKCLHPSMGGAYWLNPEGIITRCKYHVPASVPDKRP